MIDMDQQLASRELFAQQVQLDWPAYWAKFLAAHGDPVPHKGRLLFADGWQYSATDHAGPEWPPPEDETSLRQLQAAYWQERRAIVAAEKEQLGNTLTQLRNLQVGKSIPLQTRRGWWDAEAGKAASATGDLDFGEMEGRLAWLAEDVERCSKQLRQLDAACTHATTVVE